MVGYLISKGYIQGKNDPCVFTNQGVYDLRWEWVQEIRREGEVKCVAVNTKHNCADLLTKCLRREDFERLLGLCQEQVYSSSFKKIQIM